ncbi:MAG TPA: MFS transporter [Candidatus Binatia bacterium]|nr:MFS transporter [Candidatus Binatia bacterium]
MEKAAVVHHDRQVPEAWVGSGARWTVCAMLFAATSINYMDRQVIAILKPTLERSIGLTEVNYGYIVDAFQIAYAIGLVAAGRLVDRLGTRLGYVLVMCVWSVSAMAHALVGTALQFAIVRFFLGLGESGNFPAAIKTVAEWFPQNERSLATGILNSGANIGAVLAPLIVPWVTLRYGWHIAFLTTGFFSLLWIVWWLRRYRAPGSQSTLTTGGSRNTDSTATSNPGNSLPWRRLWHFRQMWGFAIAKFLTDPIWYFYLFWLPSYFSAKFSLNLLHLGLPLIIVYNVSAIGSIGGGWLPVLFRGMGLSSTRARLSAMLLCAVLVVPICVAQNLRSMWIAIALISLAAGAHQGWSANLFTTSSDMFPSSAVASVVGIGSMAGSAGSVLLAFFAGHVLQLTHSYASLFGIAAGAYLSALGILVLLAPGLKQVEMVA